MLQENLIKIYETSFRDNREMPALTDYFKGETFSYYEMAKEIAKLHLLFKKAGIKQGDKIALIGRNNPRWCITYIATITYGAVIVPILQDFTPADIIHIINHSESRMLFLGDNFWDNIEEDQIRQIEAVFSLTDFHTIYERDGKALTKFQRDILKNYRSKYPRGFSINDIKYPEIPNDRVILLNYTSGTTGYSKGVMLTVNNLTGNVIFAQRMINTQTGTFYFRKGGRTLSFLPLAHAYGCAFDFLSPLAVGGHITLLGKIPSPKILLEAMGVVRPTVICCVPMILEKVYRKQVMPMLEKGPMSIAVKIPLLNTAIYSVIRKKLLEAFGNNVDIFIVGGAPMNQETEAFLMKESWPVYTEALKFEEEEAKLKTAMDAIRSIRNIRAEADAAPSRKLTAVILASGKEAGFMKDTQHFLKNIANVQEITFIDSKDQVPDEVMSAVMNNVEIYVPLDDLLDYKAELERLKKEKTRLEGEVKRTAGKLNNAGFVAKAPEAVVNAEREKLAKYEDMLAKIIERIPVVEAKVK